MGMDDLKQQWAVTLDEKHDTFTVIGGHRGSGKIFFLENMVKFLKEQLKQEKIETERWKSAALYYADKLGSAQNLEVVRCKDCKYSKLDNISRYKSIDGEMDEAGEYECFHSWIVRQWYSGDHFCAYGERRTDV